MHMQYTHVCLSEIEKVNFKTVDIFLIFAKHRLWVRIRIASSGRFLRKPTIYVLDHQ